MVRVSRIKLFLTSWIARIKKLNAKARKSDNFQEKCKLNRTVKNIILIDLKRLKNSKGLE